VHVVVDVSRHVVVDDVRDVVDVEAARGDVGGDEHWRAAVAERLERVLALALRAVAVDRRGRQALAVEKVLDGESALRLVSTKTSVRPGTDLEQVEQNPRASRAPRPSAPAA
jgi:hypothetical protein